MSSMLDDFLGQYEAMAYCGNCSRFAYVKIKKGMKAKVFFTKMKPVCKSCGCILSYVNEPWRGGLEY